jgi:hypothetical protein
MRLAAIRSAFIGVRINFWKQDIENKVLATSSNVVCNKFFVVNQT